MRRESRRSCHHPQKQNQREEGIREIGMDAAGLDATDTARGREQESANGLVEPRPGFILLLKMMPDRFRALRLRDVMCFLDLLDGVPHRREDTPYRHGKGGCGVLHACIERPEAAIPWIATAELHGPGAQHDVTDEREQRHADT